MNAIDLLKATLPVIGAALGGPLGLGVTEFVASKLGVPQDKVAGTLSTMIGNPEQLELAKSLEREYKLHAVELGFNSILDIEKLNAQVVGVVNDTMRTEIASEHWVSYSWRPFIGFMFGLYVASLWILPLFGKVPVTLAADITLAIGGILGIASYFRGKAQADPAVPTKQISNNG